MENKELYLALKGRVIDAHQMDTDGIAAALRTISQHLDKLHPDLQGVFKKITSQMQTHLDNLRVQRYNAYEYFSGQGPVARKLCEHAAMMELFNPVNAPQAKDFLIQVRDVFNKVPTKDEDKLLELHAFIKMTMPLMSGQQLEGQEFTALESDVPLSQVKSGFYKLQGGLIARHVLVLNVDTTSAIDGIQASYVLELGREEQLLFKHPEENEWLKADGTFTFDYLVTMLQRELDGLLTPMGFHASRVDLDDEIQKIRVKADAIFELQANLDRVRCEHVNQSEEQTSIMIPVTAQFYWSFVDTRGQYPSRHYKFFKRLGSSVQSAEPAELNEFSRQNMVKFINLRLDGILAALLRDDTVEVV